MPGLVAYYVEFGFAQLLKDAKITDSLSMHKNTIKAPSGLNLLLWYNKN